MLYTVWTKHGIGIKPSQKCLMNKDGDYVGLLEGTLYSKEEHYASKQYKALVLEPDEENLTGMYHLEPGMFSHDSEHNRKGWKARFKGCFVHVEAAHKCGDVKVYRCLELGDEYFSGNELELLDDDSDAWRAYGSK